jgi:tol-pal system protein YbgF
MRRYAIGGLGAVVAALLATAPVLAQQGPPVVQRPLPPPQPTPKAAPPRDAGASSGEAGLRQRVEQLEEQLVDMQVVVGTLESLAKGAPAPVGMNSPGRGNAGAAAALNAADAGRLDSLETQLQALAAQLENLQEQMRALAGRSGALPPSSNFAGAEPPKGARTAEANPPPGREGFGAVRVSPGSQGQRDNIDQLLSQPAAPPALAGPSVGGAIAAAAPLPGGGASEADVAPKQLYETAYGYLLQRDYGAAEAAFEDFLQRFPSDPLAGNAQYWLGESLFVRGQYRSAAGAFLKGYQTYGRNAKAPESLLRLAMSLQRLGQKDAACSSFNELASKYPSAPPHVKTSAQAERQKAGC